MLNEFFDYKKEDYQEELITLFHDVTLKKPISNFKKNHFFPYVAIDFSNGTAIFFKDEHDENGTEIKFTFKF